MCSNRKPHFFATEHNFLYAIYCSLLQILPFVHEDVHLPPLTLSCRLGYCKNNWANFFKLLISFKAFCIDKGWIITCGRCASLVSRMVLNIQKTLAFFVVLHSSNSYKSRKYYITPVSRFRENHIIFCAIACLIQVLETQGSIYVAHFRTTLSLCYYSIFLRCSRSHIYEDRHKYFWKQTTSTRKYAMMNNSGCPMLSKPYP